MGSDRFMLPLFNIYAYFIGWKLKLWKKEGGMGTGKARSQMQTCADCVT